MITAMPLGPFGGTSELNPTKNRYDLYSDFMGQLIARDATLATLPGYRLSSLTIGLGGSNVVTSLTGSWTNPATATITASGIIGKTGSSTQTVLIAAGDYLTGLNGSIWANNQYGGTGVCSLQFQTKNLGWLTTIYGTTSISNPTVSPPNLISSFFVELPPTSQIIGFFGNTAGWPLASLGVYVAPIPS